MSNKSRKTLSARLAELTSSAPCTAFNPDAPDFDDGTGAGLQRYDDDDNYDEGGDSKMNQHRPSADLRVAADMESIGQEYHGKRVSRKSLEATAVGDAHDPDQASEGDGSSDDDGNDDGDISESGDGTAASSSRKMVPSLNLDDVSSSEEGEEDEDDEDGDMTASSPPKRGSGQGAGKRVHWGGREDEEDGGGGGAGGGKRQRQQQASVFAGVRGGDVDTGASVEEQMKQLDEQDEKARRDGGGIAGQGELRRAREALRQREWWDSLLEVRILLQRLMNAANKLPGPNELPLFLEGDEQLTALAEESAGAAQGLATQLSAVRRSHMSCWGIANIKSGDSGSGSGDAGKAAMVTNDDDEQKVGNDNGKDKGEGPTTISEGNAEGEEAVAATEHGSCMGWWSDVLGRWHERTQLVDPGLQKKFKVVNQGPWAQITASLADRERANRRSFMTESETSEFLGRKLAKHLDAAKGDGDAGSAAAAAAAAAGGRSDDEGDEDVVGRVRRKDGAEPLDLEVVDDRNLYQHLLKEFMDASGTAGSGYSAVPVRRKSRKKSVDRKASKGRKIKYVTHPKMQNFMFPQEYEAPPMEPSELFASLFGGAGRTQQPDTKYK
ncbi:conserved unknown protein [Ectocarpus siliculosus]|uniref:Apoptosis antagonizing transcription factor n=1 Tax=Ectocarpus siliculosus TaxID=2880 RepID=D7FIB2_ECTSI|nr:conserved unknown protein [Ectocarpus siliculosus]|eukprot:CBJ28736.1 conserved unknown protein [Ectocarpus siliculosus]